MLSCQIVLFGFFFFVLTVWVEGNSVNPDAASRVVRGWLRQDPDPMNTVMAGQIASVQSCSDSQNQILYYAVLLEPQGFVIVPADNELEPILAFSPLGTYEPNPDNPLTTLLENDLAGRMENLAPVNQIDSLTETQAANQGKWQSLLALTEDESLIVVQGISGVSDVRVAPLLQSEWDQAEEYGQPCYNYYTPSNYPTGCVATAMAQLIRFYQHPMAGIGYNPYTIYVYGSPLTTWTLGGDGAGGPYQWSQMPLVPDASITTQQRQAIGALCHDTGASVGMDYESGGSSASMADAKDAIVDVFDYASNAYGIGQSAGAIPMSTLYKMLNPNLDAGMPVILGIKRPGSGHAVIADGYGYNSNTLYHHLNMGWGGTDNVWYALPLIDASYTYDTINECVYNVYISGDGEIISGRILSSIGLPVEGALVKAYYGQTLTAQTSTNAMGIYALTKLTSSRTYSVQPEKTGYDIPAQNVTVGASIDNNSLTNPVCGNVWGANFTAESAGPPVAYNQSLSVTNETELYITLVATDDGLPNPPGALQYVITSLPQHGWLFDPSAGEILLVPYVLQNAAHQARYVPCAYYSLGSDLFTFAANDGASASNSATISIAIDKTSETLVETSLKYIINQPIQADYHDGRTQVIYRSAEVGSAQTFTDLALNIYTLPGGTLNNFRIRMKHTAKSQYNISTDDFENTGWTDVFAGNVSFTADGWHTLHFQTPFAYNGTSNLMIDFTFDNSASVGAGDVIFCDNSTSGIRIFFQSANSQYGDPRYWTRSMFGGYMSYYSTGYLNLKLTGVPTAQQVQGDVSYDCRVNLRDLALIAKAWLTSQGDPDYDEACDISAADDNQITLDDLAVIAENWITIYVQ